MVRHKYKKIGKPLHPKKQEALFEMFDAWRDSSGSNNLENLDWQILGEQCGEIIVQNKHTYEIFNFRILSI